MNKIKLIQADLLERKKEGSGLDTDLRYHYTVPDLRDRFSLLVTLVVLQTQPPQYFILLYFELPHCAFLTAIL